MFTYTVTCTFNDSATAEEWITWLRDEHLAEVLKCGAQDAEVIQLDGESCRCEVRYHFQSRASFAQYERDHAPRLRVDGLKRFPPERGLKYERSTGDVRCSVSAAGR